MFGAPRSLAPVMDYVEDEIARKITVDRYVPKKKIMLRCSNASGTCDGLCRRLYGMVRNNTADRNVWKKKSS